MSFKQLRYIFGQVLGMLFFLAAGFAVGYIYFVGAQKNAEKQESVTETPVSLTPVEPIEIEGPEPISQPISKAERLAKVKERAIVRPAKALKPVAHSAPKKATVKPVKKPKAATKKRVAPAKAVPVAQRRIAPTKTQIRNLAIKSAERLDYSAPEFRAGLKEQAKSILQFRATDKSRPEQLVNREEQKK